MKLEAILRGVEDGTQSVPVSDLRLAGQPHKYSALVDELGKSAVVCFTGTPNPSVPRPQRLTAWFSIEVSGNTATFSPSRPAALESATEAPCDPNFIAPAGAKMETVSQTNPERSLQNVAPSWSSVRPTGSVPQPNGGAGMDPANFAAIQAVASLRQQKWTLNVMALQVGMHRDTSLQVIVVDATDHLKALPVSRENVMHSTSTTALLDELGKGLVVCYTAIDDSGVQNDVIVCGAGTGEPGEVCSVAARDDNSGERWAMPVKKRLG